MRAFFGLEPNAETKSAIEVWRNQAFPQLLAPVPAVNFHITLAFLGNITAQQFHSLTRLVDEMPRVAAFDISLNQLGYWSKPKAFWLGCEKTATEHLNLVAEINKLAQMAGLRLQQQNYTAHLTLARKCKAKPDIFSAAADFQWRANEFHLFASKPSEQGVYYPIQQSWLLG